MKNRSKVILCCLFSLVARVYADITFSDRQPDTAGEGFVTFTFKARDENGSNARKVKVLLKGGSLEKKIKMKPSVSNGVFSVVSKRSLSPGTYKWRIKVKNQNKSSWKTLTVTGGTPAPTPTSNTPAPTPVPNTPAPTPNSNTPAPTPAPNDLIENAKADILALTTNNIPLKAKFLRLGFHDCVGGCNGCVSSNLYFHRIYVCCSILDMSFKGGPPGA